jgi:hypothetical protein
LIGDSICLAGRLITVVEHLPFSLQLLSSRL